MGLYILNHTHAAIIYFQSAGLMPQTSLETISNTLKLLLNKGNEDWIKSSLIHQELFPTHDNQSVAVGNCIFLYYLKLIFRKKEGRAWVWKINSEGTRTADLIESNYELYKNEIRRKLFNLEFIRVIISYLFDYPNSNFEEIQSRLGSDMNEFGVNLAKIGIARLAKKGTMMKPFNPAVLKSILDLMTDLGIISKHERRYRILELNNEEMSIISKNFDDLIIWTNEIEQIILASLIDIFERQEFIKILSPFLQKKIFQKLNQLNLLDGKKIKIITKINLEENASDEIVENLEALKYLNAISSIEVKYTNHHPIHANLIASNKCAIITSSNLTDTGLSINVEYGTAYFNKIKIHQINQHFDNIWIDPIFRNLDFNIL
ncbi:MAG: phospholipase D-like domain-containing protein [Candidatus Helarchaeota archaeon]